MPWYRVVLFSVLLIQISACQLSRPGADVILLSGQIHTMNEQQPLVQALAIRQGKIVAVGSNQQILTWQSPQTQLINLQGRMALPGLIDSHLHSIEGALALDACSMDDEKLSNEELAQRIRQCDESQPGGDWLQVLNVRSVGTRIDRQWLDSVLPTRPLFVVSTDAHTAWANSLALEQAGVTAATIAPVTGTIGKDPQGELNGVLLDGATALVSKIIPDMPVEQRVAALKRVIKQLNQAGITGYLEANSNEASIDTFCALTAEGPLSVHVTIALGSTGEPDEAEFARLQALREKARQCGLQADTIKLFADGVMEYPTQTAALLLPYLDENGQPGDYRGPLYLPVARLNAFCLEAMKRDFSLHVHAIGDGAVREVLNAFDYAIQQVPGSQSRLSMAHLQLVDPTDYPRMARLQVIASMQLLWAQPDEYSVDAVLPYIGESRHKRLYPAASLVNAGVTLAGGSDWNVSSFNPFEAMAIGISRVNPAHPEWPALNADQALKLPVMLQAYTINAARLMGQEQQIAQIKVGMDADVIVLDQPLDEDSPPQQIATTQVTLTLFKGQVVYSQLPQVVEH